MQSSRTPHIDEIYLVAAPASRRVKMPASKPAEVVLPRRNVVLTVLAGVGLAGVSGGLLAGTRATADAAPAAIPLPKAVTVINPGPALAVATEADKREWALFKATMMTQDGRITDTSNGNESHSEGQGVGMLFAEAHDDQESFDRLYNWTKRHLLRSDGLHAWRYLPNAAVNVPDTNNATDGDIYIAAALQRAARRWKRTDYAEASMRTARGIHELLLQTVGNRVVLLPGGHGFVHRDKVSINLSYYVFPLLTELNCAYPSARWDRVRDDGLAIIQAARYGHWGLPPDWLDISQDGALSVASGFPPRFSWDAVRVPLFLAWGGHDADAVQAAAAFWNHVPHHPPAWVDLRTGEMAGYGAPPGVQAIAAVATATAHNDGRPIHAVVPTVANDTYYSAALTLLSRMALRELANVQTQA